MRNARWLLPAFTSLVVACSGATGSGGDPIEPGSEGGIETSPIDETSTDTPPPDTGAPDTTLPVEDTRPKDDETAPLEAGEGGVIPGCGLDTDGDGITDVIEGKGKGPGGTDIDTDGDGIPDYKDLDSDNDGIPDVVEWAVPGCETPFAELNDADGDGIPNFQDLDSDGNGLPDKDEACPPKEMLEKLSFPACSPLKPYDFDGDGVPDYLDFDNDHDSSKADKTLGLSDKIELSDASGKYVGLVDSDGDGIPDLYDRDSDNDFILDLDDGTTDPDGDGKPNFRDDDSDGDGVKDACEARGKASPTAGDYTLPLLDTDGDGIPDYLDKDSDGDLLGDGAEDKNGNCVVDADETDRLKADTDGDGVSDLVEVTLLGPAAAKDPTTDPAKAGKFYFLEPYSADGSAKPTPTSSPLALNTNINRGDVGIVVDTTGSMEGTINGLKGELKTVIDSLSKKIPDLGIGVAGHDDVPNSVEGSCKATSYLISLIPPKSITLGPDKIWYLPTNGYVRDVSKAGVVIAAGVSQAQSAVDGLRLSDGLDLPESQVPALVHAIRGDVLDWSKQGSCAAGSEPADVGDGTTTFGGLHFRKAALPILISASDAVFHNGIKAGTTAIHDPYSSSASSLPNMNALVAAIKAANARFIGVAAADASTPDTDAAIRNASSARSAYGDMAYLTDNTSSNVPPSAFGGSCKTGIGGATVAADGPGGTCRLVFSLRHNGTGLGATIVDGVSALLAGIKFDVHVQAIPAAGPVDSVDTFIEKVEPSPTGGTDPVTGAACVTFAATSLADRYKTPKAAAGPGDIQETITQITPGPKYCFNVVPKPNVTIKPTTSPQLFTATLRVLAENGSTTLTLGTDRDVLFIVPPVLN